LKLEEREEKAETQSNFRGMRMTKKLIVVLSALNLLSGIGGARSGPPGLAQESQPQTVNHANGRAEAARESAPVSPPTNTTALPRGPQVPSPAEYPFSEALRQLQNVKVPNDRREQTTVPPLKVVPLPPHAPRSTAIPKNYVSKKDIALAPTGQEAVVVGRQWQDSTDIPAPGKDGRVVYVFGAGMPVVVCAPLRVCVVELEPGEKIVGEPQIGDSVRWEISPASAGTGDTATPLLVIKPTAVGLDTTMMVPTDRRAYYLRLQSKPDDYIARVAFSYPQEQAQQWQEYQQRQNAAHSQPEARTTTEPKPQTQEDTKNGKALPDKAAAPDVVDFLYWDYSIRGGDPTMRPVRVLDDGAKTYIQMPAATARTEAPVLVVVGPDGSEMVNYRVKYGVYIVDRLFNRAALIVGMGKHSKKIEITRKIQIGDDKAQGKQESDSSGRANSSSNSNEDQTQKGGEL
jgi:type IV secretion system protein VirB9